MSDFSRIRGAPGSEVVGPRASDQQLPGRPDQERSDQSDEEARKLAEAIAELNAAASRLTVEMAFHLDPDLDIVVITIQEQGRRRVLRKMSALEAIRLAELTRAGRQQLLDRLL